MNAMQDAMQDAVLAVLKNNPALAAQVADALNAPKPGSRFAKKAKKGKAKVAFVGKTERRVAFAAKVVATFKAKGLDVIPMQDVLTHGKWAELGMEPKQGEKATFIKMPGMNGNGIPLFHVAQVEPLRSPR